MLCEVKINEKGQNCHWQENEKNGKVMNEWNIALPVHKDESQSSIVEWEKQMSDDDKHFHTGQKLATTNNMYY